MSARPLLVIAVAIALGGCGGGDRPPAASRVDRVAGNGTAPDPARWCDAFYPGDTGPAFTLPRVEPARPGGPAAGPVPGRWIWVNVWATWCGPCRREMPLLLRWRDQMAKEGVDLDLWFLSVDESAQELHRFLNEHPDVAPGNSVRLVAYRDLERWLGGFQREPSTGIPVQVIATPAGHVRCVRAGSLRDGDYPLVKALAR